MHTRMVLVALTAMLLMLAGCTDPFGPTEGRPGIPMPEEYTGSVPTESDIMVVAEAPAQSFSPVVTAAWAADGSSLGVTGRTTLVDEGVIVTDPDIHADAQPLPAGQTPTLQLIRYWVRIDGPESFAGGAEVSRSTTTTTGTSSTNTQTFSQTLSVEAEASVGGLFASASVKTSASFTSTQGFSSTTSTEESITKTFTVSPISGTNLLYSVWQLYEEIRYVSGTGPDAELFDVTAYDFDQGSLRFVFPTDEIAPISAYYEN